MFARSLSAAMLVCAFATPVLAYDEFAPSTTARQRFVWGQQAYPYYCNVSPPSHIRRLRFEDLSPVAQAALGWASKQQIADYIESNCGQESSVAANYLN